MEREEAKRKLSELIGVDLVSLAKSLDCELRPGGKLNKGWAGLTIERYLGLPRNSLRAPNFGSWELKQCSLKYLRSGNLVVKETVALTMLDPVEVAGKEFEESHLFMKIRKMLLLARIHESKEETRSIVHSVCEFDLRDGPVLQAIRQDYDAIRSVILEQGPTGLSGRIGRLIQPRTKGPGHGSRSRAFYARKPLVAHILELQPLEL